MALDRPFDPETKIVSRTSRPDVIERGCDICVVGSGASGMSAAIEAARAGREVILVDGHRFRYRSVFSDRDWRVCRRRWRPGRGRSLE